MSSFFFFSNYLINKVFFINLKVGETIHKFELQVNHYVELCIITKWQKRLLNH